MIKEDLVYEYIDLIKKDQYQLEEIDNIDFDIMGYSDSINNINYLIENFKIDDLDLYNLNPESKILFVITDGQPLITLKVVLSNIYQNKKIVLFINNNFVGVNTFLINKYTKIKIKYDLNGEMFLENSQSYNKYIALAKKFDEILFIGEEEMYNEIKKDFNNIKYIKE